MANASVEKLKTLGLRHGEKAVVGLAAALCVLFLFLAVSRKTIQLTPEQVKKAADAAASNINRPQETSEILKRLEDQFLKKPEFEASVEKQEKTVLVASDYKLRKPFVTFEPGGGLLRDKPELIAVSELYAYPGRGGILMYKLDADGNREIDTGEKVVDAGTKFRRKKKRRAQGGMMGGMMGGAPKKKKVVKERPKTKEELLKEAMAERKKREAMVAGDPKGAPQEEVKEDDGGKENWKETTVGKRWVVLTGTIDHKQLQENFLTALKRPEVAQPHYKRLDVERQVLQPDGSWSEWALVDENLDILENLPEEEEEWTPESVRIRELVDPLPFLKAGSWEHVHIGSLVPKEKLDVPMPVAPEGVTPPGSPPGSSSGAMMQSVSRPLPPPTSAGSGMMMSGGMMPGGAMSGNQMGGASETTDFTTTEADTIMLRSLDFTAEPDMTYRYRVRIVLFNPNFEREDVNPGVDNKAKTLFGPWSKPTDDVTMPADVTAYVMDNAPGGKNGEVQFHVTRWDPADGVTVVKNFDAGPGDVVGEPRLTDIPSAEGKGLKSRPVDFISHQVILDVVGGKKPLPALGINGAPFEYPPLSLLMRPDGALVLRSAALDKKDEVRDNIESNYKKEKEESSKERKSSMGSGAMKGGSPPMMPGMQGPPGRGR